MGLVSTHTIPRLLDLLSAGKLETAALMVTHGKLCRLACLVLRTFKLTYRVHSADFKFDEVEKAYDVFNRAKETQALKVNIEF
jgi:threonine dehydrogenase-like Zn-dependent dehydrogenase